MSRSGTWNEEFDDEGSLCWERDGIPLKIRVEIIKQTGVTIRDNKGKPCFTNAYNDKIDTLIDQKTQTDTVESRGNRCQGTEENHPLVPKSVTGFPLLWQPVMRDCKLTHLEVSSDNTDTFYI